MKLIPLLVAVGLLVGCATATPMKVSEGNRSKGEVILSAEYSILQPPSLDMQQGMATAAEQCQQWGYVSAVPDGKPARSCVSEMENGQCIGWAMNAKFLCTGASE